MSEQPVAVVTGTSTGFGYLIAEQLAAAGYRVYATMRDPRGRNAAPRAALEALGVRVHELDVTQQSSVDAAAAAILADAGRIDVLVNNAGTAHMGVTEAHTAESMERQLATNVVGPVRLNRAFLPQMRAQQRGLIVFVSSVVGRLAIPFTGIYNASKFALEGLAESLSYELRPFGIDIAIVEPGAYSTNIINVVVGPDDAARVVEYGETAKLFDRIGEALSASAGDPIEVARAVTALAQAPAGTRPLRTVVPADSPVVAVNAAIEPIQHALLESFGLGALLPKAPAAV